MEIRQGLLRDVRPLRLPAGIGGDAAEIVDEVGAGVTDVQVGDAVVGSGRETYAVLTSWAPKPPEVSFEEGAGFATPFETAVRVLDAVGVRTGHRAGRADRRPAGSCPSLTSPPPSTAPRCPPVSGRTGPTPDAKAHAWP